MLYDRDRHVKLTSATWNVDAAHATITEIVSGSLKQYSPVGYWPSHPLDDNGTPTIFYNLYLGGAHEGSRLNKLHRRDVDGDEIVAALSPLFGDYAKERTDGEHFGDYVIRAGVVKETTAGLNFHENLSAEVGN